MFKKILPLLFTLVALSTVAQTKNIYHDNLIWTQYVLKGQLTDKWSASIDLGYRTHNYANKEAQFFIRPFITYQISPKVNVQAGYAYFETNQFLGGYPEVMRPEQRLFQRVTVNQNAGRVEFRHRYRMEERFNRNVNKGVLQDGYSQTFRFSYQIYVSVPLNNTKIKEKTIYIFAFDELFVSFGKKVFNNFDQNRLAGGFGYQFAKGFGATMYYQYIYGQQASGSQLYAYNAFCFAVNQTLDFRKKEITHIQK